MREVWGIYLSEHCDFQNTLEEMLRNQLVCGVNNEQIQRMLLAERSNFAELFLAIFLSNSGVN